MKLSLLALAAVCSLGTLASHSARAESIGFGPRKLRFLERCYLPTDTDRATGFLDDNYNCVPWMPSVYESSFEGNDDGAPSDIEL